MLTEWDYWKLLRPSVRNLDLALVLSVSSLARRAPRVLGGRYLNEEFERTGLVGFWSKLTGVRSSIWAI